MIIIKKMLFLGFLTVLPLFYFIFFSDKSTETVISTKSDVRTQEITQNQKVPFEELTIEFLGNKKYESRLGQIKEFSDSSNFTTYTTSYNSDGLTINSLLTIPKDKMPEKGWPGVIFIHGYIPPKQYSTTMNYLTYVNYLAGNDTAVLKIDLRGHGNSEGTAEGAYYSSGYIIDTLNAYSAMQNADFINPEKIGLWGHSMAGNIVLRTVAVKKNIPKAVIWAGAVYTYKDLQDFRIEDNSYVPAPQDSDVRKRRQMLFDAHGEFDQNSEFWQRVVPVNFLDNVSTQIQIHHALNDNVVDIRYSRNLADILQDKEKGYELFEYENGGHNISGDSFNIAMQRTADFLKNYN